MKEMVRRYRSSLENGTTVTSRSITITDSPAHEQPLEGSTLAYDRAGVGEPLVLLHGLGASRRSWDPVVAALVAQRDVIAVDLPGHGDSSPSWARDSAPADIAARVARLLDELGLQTAHLGGNSLGGWVALELAKYGRARSVTAFSPAGLWARKPPAYLRASLRHSRFNARIVRRLAPSAPRTRLARSLFFAQASAHPSRVPYELGRRTVHDMATTSGYRRAVRGIERNRFKDGALITVPVTVVFGRGDQVLLRRSTRRREELPTHTRWVDLPGSGHMPMLDDAPAVARLLLDGSGVSQIGR
jgi:pimeloyl-ACP methyl ester carboxylesterase